MNKAKNKQRTKNKEQRADEEWLKTNVGLTKLSDRLRESIGWIVCMFGDELMTFKFPPVVVSSAGAQGLLLMSRTLG